jgi:hypothetical protein
MIVLEKRNYRTCLHEETYNKVLVYVTMEAEKTHDLLSGAKNQEKQVVYFKEV